MHKSSVGVSGVIETLPAVESTSASVSQYTKRRTTDVFPINISMQEEYLNSQAQFMTNAVEEALAEI